MHTLSDMRCRGKYLSPNTCLCLILNLIWFEFCDYQNIGLLRNINNIHKHYLYQHGGLGLGSWGLALKTWNKKRYKWLS